MNKQYIKIRYAAAIGSCVREMIKENLTTAWIMFGRAEGYLDLLSNKETVAERKRLEDIGEELEELNDGAVNPLHEV